MSCDICGRGACANWMHPEEEQKRYEKVIAAFARARDLRDAVKHEERLSSADDSTGDPT